MDTQTGKIHEFKDSEELKKALEENPDLISVEQHQLTAKQKLNKQVSKYDSVSELGRLFNGNRKERRKYAKRLKKKLKK